MGEVAKRTDEEQIEIEDAVLALTEAGWTQRQITKELGISPKSIKPYRERAIARIEIPDRDAVIRENIVQMQTKMEEITRRLADEKLPITATNVPNLYHQWDKLRMDLNKVLDVGTKTKVEHGLEGSFFEYIKNNTESVEEAMSAGLREDEKRRNAWLERDDVEHSADLERDPADGVFKLPSEFIEQGDEDYT